jgi:hypothetical protein
MKFLVKVQLNIRKVVEVTDEEVKTYKNRYMSGETAERIAEIRVLEQSKHMAATLSAVEPGLEVDASTYADAVKIPEEKENDESNS